ncbi:MAG: aminotransferase class V-fold PLP-dependent enzyme, partial [Bacteriovoracales bacterium]|nr:aminotransferase class V-fold PLP-dependent enzyme [Bacteriovoracales bacterium]
MTEFQKTADFENKISSFVGAPHCVVTVNGTVALSLALMTVGVGIDDEVLVPNLTMIATPNSVQLLKGKVVLVDVEPESLCMDVKLIEKNITKKTKALLYVSLNGRSGNLKQVREICQAYNIFLIEDAAQSFGSYHNGLHLGRYGDMGVFSFSMPKIITTGQGGAIIFDENKYKKKLRKLKDFGRENGGHDIHDDIGYNFKFTDIQSVIGLAQLEMISKRVSRKKKLYSTYRDEFSSIPEIQFLPTNLEETTPWFVDIFLEKRDALMAYLKENFIGSR